MPVDLAILDHDISRNSDKKIHKDNMFWPANKNEIEAEAQTERTFQFLTLVVQVNQVFNKK